MTKPTYVQWPLMSSNKGVGRFGARLCGQAENVFTRASASAEAVDPSVHGRDSRLGSLMDGVHGAFRD